MKLTIISAAVLAAVIIFALAAGAAIDRLCADTLELLEQARALPGPASAETVGKAIERWEKSGLLLAALFNHTQPDEVLSSMVRAVEYASAGDSALFMGETSHAILSVSSMRDSVRPTLRNIF